VLPDAQGRDPALADALDGAAPSLEPPQFDAEPSAAGDEAVGAPQAAAVAVAALPAGMRHGGEPISDAAPPTPAGGRWGDLVSAERAAQLAAMQRDRESSRPRAAPFAGVHLDGADVFTLAVWVLAGDGDSAAVETNLRAARHDVALRAALDLSGLNLEGADLAGADLEGAALRGALLSGANLRRANLRRANLEGADLDRADLGDALLRVAHLDGASLRSAHLRLANLGGASLARANLRRADLERAVLVLANLEGANCRGALFAAANLAEARLDGALLAEAVLQGANLHKAHLAGTNLTRAHLEGANLRLAVCDAATQLDEAFLNRAAMAHLTFGGANLSLVYWGEVQRLGDEVEARRPRTLNVVYRDSDWRVEEAGRRKLPWMKSGEFTDAARAYRALAVALRAQGLSKDATRFHYRSELMARHALFYDVIARLFSARFYSVPWVAGRWLVSLLLGVFVGYGDYIGRLLSTYLLVVLGFATAYLLQWRVALTLPNALDVLALSFTAFHGHGLTPPGMILSHAMLWQTGAESLLGLLIEALFVAAFTRRMIGN
jgi:uncharacterized protein YjbI with pentapeptide repeats